MAMRVTGMMSGLDTESIIQQLVAARQTKVDTLKKKQTQHGWKQEAWKDLNAKIYKLYNGSLNNLQYTSSFVKKMTTVSNSNLVSVITKDSAMDSVQSLKIKHLAKAGYLTGGTIEGTDGKKLSSSSKVAESLGIDAGSTFEVNANGKKTEITIDEDTTINSLVNQLKAAGVSANFDAGQQRFYIGANALGEEADFTIIGSDSEGTDALKKLGILYYGDNEKKAYEEYANMSAEDIASMKQSRVEARVAALTAERESLNKSNEELDKRVAECVEEYNKEYGQNGTYDLADESQRNSRKAFLDSEISRLEGLDSLSAEEQADLDKYKGEMSYVKGYEDLQKEIKTNTDRLVEISSSIDADGNATNALKSEVDVEVTAKIDEAKKIVNGWDSTYEGKGSASNKQVGQNAEIELNGVQYFSDSNTFDINGLTITCNGTTAENEVVTLSTKNDTSGIYDMIKGFIKEYSALINEMDKLYNAESAKGYEPLTDEEKEAMSESEIEKWESKIKDSLLRRDGTLNTVASAMKEIMMSGFEVNGKKMYLYDFGMRPWDTSMRLIMKRMLTTFMATKMMRHSRMNQIN